MSSSHAKWKNDEELFSLIKKELYTPVLGDILDTYHCFHQFLPQKIRPLKLEMKVLGRAMPVLMEDVYGIQKEPFGKMMEALDSLQEREVYVAAGNSHRCATWGEIMTAAAKARKSAGAVLYGYHRDSPKVLEQNFPVFSCGAYAQDSAPRMKVVDYRIPLKVADVQIEVGDLIVGDRDGILVIPKKLENEVLSMALEKARTEKTVRQELEQGASVVEVFNTYKVL